jgi:hypothetical protein
MLEKFKELAKSVIKFNLERSNDEAFIQINLNMTISNIWYKVSKENKNVMKLIDEKNKENSTNLFPKTFSNLHRTLSTNYELLNFDRMLNAVAADLRRNNRNNN